LLCQLQIGFAKVKKFDLSAPRRLEKNKKFALSAPRRLNKNKKFALSAPKGAIIFKGVPHIL
jgi:hypothetical protein